MLILCKFSYSWCHTFNYIPLIVPENYSILSQISAPDSYTFSWQLLYFKITGLEVKLTTRRPISSRIKAKAVQKHTYLAFLSNNKKLRLLSYRRKQSKSLLIYNQMLENYINYWTQRKTSLKCFWSFT